MSEVVYLMCRKTRSEWSRLNCLNLSFHGVKRPAEDTTTEILLPPIPGKFCGPGNTPERDTNLEHDELIEYVDLPAIPFATRSHYLKVRDRASYAFALLSVAAALDLDSSKKIKAARVALGGVAHKPWRASAAEKKLIGQIADEKTFRAAAEAELAAAKGYKHNSFKIELAKRAIVRALTTIGGTA